MYIIIFLVLCLGFQATQAVFSEKQFQETMNLFKSACIPKTGVTDSALNAMRQGTFDESDQNLKCYIYCMFEMGGTTTKKKEINEAKVKTQANLILPPAVKVIALKQWEHCKPFAAKKYKDHCERAFHFIKCAYELTNERFAL